MEVLHEETPASIRDLGPDFTPSRREFKTADAALHVEVDHRVQPLEAAVSRHSRILRRHGLDAKE